MIFAAAAVLTVTVLVLAAALVFVVGEQRQQATELTRLTQCVFILGRNQGKPKGDLSMGCPIYNWASNGIASIGT